MAANCGDIAQDMFGLITTTSPRETNRWIPPAASNTFLVKSRTENPSVWPTPSIINRLFAVTANASVLVNADHWTAPESTVYPDNCNSFRIDSLREIGLSYFIVFTLFKLVPVRPNYLDSHILDFTRIAYYTPTTNNALKFNLWKSITAVHAPIRNVQFLSLPACLFPIHKPYQRLPRKGVVETEATVHL